MRVLLIYPEFPQCFFTLKHTCAITGYKALLPPLALMTVAALLPEEWHYRLVDLNTSRLSAEDWQWADLVMLSGMIVQRDGLLALIREGKQRGKTIAVGGPYPTSLPQEVLDAGADFLVRGEGEHTIPLFLAAWREGRKAGVFQENGKPDLATSPIPRFDLINMDDYVAMGVQTSRGCPHDCEFCDIVNLYGRKPRYKQPEQVLAELSALHRMGWNREIFICDDNFIGNRRHARAILREMVPWMKSRGEPFNFWTQTSVDLGQDLEMMDLMTLANFSNVFVGAETPDLEVLTSTHKLQNVRNPLGDSLVNIGANGLGLMASFIIGFDGEQPGAGDRICRFAEENNLPVVLVNVLQALPHTRLWNRLEREGRLLPDNTTGETTLCGLMNFLPDRPEAEIREEYLRAVEYLYEPRRYLARLYRFFLTMRPTRRYMALQRGEKGGDAADKKPPLLRDKYRDLRSFLRLIWRQGIRAPYRLQFWQQLAGIYRQNPSRLIKYLLNCVMAENVFWLRDMIRQGASHAMGASDPVSPSKPCAPARSSVAAK